MTASRPRRAGFYVALVVGLLMLCGALAVAMRGLPGLQNSPTATVEGKSVVGKTGN